MISILGSLLLKKIQNKNEISVYSQLKEDIETEKRKRNQWEKDNIRRRHNWMPFVVDILNHMAEQNLLVPAVKKVIIL